MSDTKIKNGLIIDDFRNKYWYKNDLLHRVGDLPAIEYTDGSKAWWLNGEKHRDNDLPAVENINGYKEWRRYGKLHREDGPAIEYKNGYKEWWINNKKLDEEQFDYYLEMKKLNEQLHQDLVVNNHNIKLPKI